MVYQTKTLSKMLRNSIGDYIVETLDIDENIESQTGMYTAAVFADHADGFNHYCYSCCHDSVSRY